MNKERNYGIDLLRLVLMFMVCVLHTLGQGGILNATVSGSLSFKVFWFLEILCYCSVDSFAIISGYMATGKERKLEKLPNMWFQAFFYSFVVSLILTIVGINKTWSGHDMLSCALPVMYEKFWYFTAYFALFLAMPVFDRYLFSIDETHAKKAFTILFVLSVIALQKDPFKANRGYSTIWLMVLYCVGVLAKRIKLFETKRTITLILIWAFCVLLTWGRIAWNGNRDFVNYRSPTIVVSALIMVILFARIRLKGTIISKLSPLAFGIYLLQMNPVIWSYVLKDAFINVADQSLQISVPLVFACALAIFVIGLIVEFIRSKLARLFRIHVLSEKIVRFFSIINEKIIVILK